MMFKGLSEPLVGRVCSAKTLAKHVGSNFLGPISKSNPLVELIGVALSDDEKSLLVHVHVATEASKFIGTTQVTVTWYERQFETHSLLRGSPSDLDALEQVPCQYVESPESRQRKAPTIFEMVKNGEVAFARDLASAWFKGRQPMRKTEQLFLALMNHEDRSIQETAQAGLSLLIEALSGQTISPALKRKIGEICIVLGRLDPPKPTKQCD